MPKRRSLPVLRRPLDPAKPLAPQYKERWDALLAQYGFSEDRPNLRDDLIVRMMLDLYPKAFEVRVSQLDPRKKVVDEGALLALVSSVTKGELTSDPKLVREVQKWLQQRNLLPNDTNICKALAAIPSSQWKGINASTLRDVVARSQHYRSKRTAKEAVTRGLKEAVQFAFRTGNRPLEDIE